jgi:hypothetical protein
MMAYEYSAQNHDWDMTMLASTKLMQAGVVADKQERTGNMSMGFAFFTGGMVLAFAAMESIADSIAFTMKDEPRFPAFDFEKYRRTTRFWDKMEMLCSAAGISVDKSQGIFQRIDQMQHWRNLVTHASPYEIEPTVIVDTIKEPGKLHKKWHRQDYLRSVDLQNAKMFHETALEFIDLIKKATDLDPRAMASYKNLGDQGDKRVDRTK